MSPEAQQNLDIQQTQAHSTVVDEGTSYKTLTSEEVLTMKQQNPVKTLRKLQLLRQVSTEVQPSSSIVAPAPEMDASVTLKLQQLRDYLFKREILIVVEEEESLGLNILKLLDELARHELPAPVVRYLIEFEAFFTQLIKDLALCRNDDFQINTTVNKMRRE